MNNGLLLACLLASFASAFNARSYDPLIDGIAASFSVELLQASGLLTRFMWGYAAGQVIAFFATARNRRQWLTFCCLGGAVLVVWSAFAPFEQMLSLRWMTGFFVGPLIPLSIALIGDHTTVSLRTRVMTQFMAGQALGISLSVPLSVLLVQLGDVRWAQLSGALSLLLGAALMRGGRAVTVAPSAQASMPPPRDRPALKPVLALYGTVMLEGAIVFGLLATAPLLMPSLPAYLPALSFGLIGVLFIGLVSYVGKGLRRGALFGTVMIVLGTVLALVGGVFFLPAFFCLAMGYYSLHPSLQSRATQLSTYYRGATTAMFAVCFFAGQAIGAWLLVRMLTAGVL